MAKVKTRYVCQQCGAQSPRWLGRCPSCSEWNSMVEEIEQAAAPSGRPSLDSGSPTAISDIGLDDHIRTPTAISEFDRILGGGFVAGSAVLVGGEPGIGKSTLMLQVCDRVARAGSSALYVTGEESLTQMALRAKRLGIKSDRLMVAAQTSLDAIMAQARKLDAAKRPADPGIEK